MIVSLLAILFSMYLLYVVPIQGRDAEISHMKYITQEFIGLKADIDGLIINDKINMPISRSFELGTLSSVGKGSFSVMPMSSFIEAAGTLMVNEQNDYLTVTVKGNFVDYSEIDQKIQERLDLLNLNEPTNTQFTLKGLDDLQLFVDNYSTQRIHFSLSNPEDLDSGKITYILENPDRATEPTNPPSGFGIPFYFGSTRLYVLKPIWRSYTENNPEFVTPTPTPPATPIPEFIRTERIDLVLQGYSIPQLSPPYTFVNFIPYQDKEDFDTVTSKKKLIYEKTIIENVQDNTDYTVNLFNNNELIPESMEDYSKMHPHWIEEIRDTLIQMEYSKYDNYIGPDSAKPIYPETPILVTTHLKGQTEPPQIGSLQYWSQNRYWVNQELLYEMGGLFLKQSDGVSIMLVPSISATEVTDIDGTSNFKLTLTNIRITDTEDVSGSLSAQVFSKVDSISHSLIYGSQLKAGESPGDATTDPNYWKLQEGTPNAQFLWIKYVPEMDLEPDRKEASVRLWKRGFDQIKTIASKALTGSSSTVDAKNWITVVTVIDTRTTTSKEKKYSANLIIGYQFNPSSCVSSDDVYGCSLDQLEADVNTFTAVPHTPFILDYKEAELSLVMQSGAL